MKIGIISDIHSNIDALEKVFEFMKIEGVDKIICLGDIIGIGPFPEKCIEYIIKNEDCFISCVKGNHERYLLSGITRHNHKDMKPMGDELVIMFKHNHLRINHNHIKYLRKMKYKDIIAIEGKKILIEHYHSNNKGKYDKFYKKPTIEELTQLYSNEDADIYLFGHTHEKIYIENENKHYINPGSLGCPKGTECANCGILEINAQNVFYKQIEVKYNIEKVIDDIQKSGYKESNMIIQHFYR